MKHIFLCLCIFVSMFASLSIAAAQKSILHPQHLATFNHAVELIDGYRGDNASLEKARAELAAVLKANPEYAPAYKEIARYFIMIGHISNGKFQSGALEAADKAITKAIELDPRYAEAFVLRGHLYRLMNRHQNAISALEMAEKLGTSDPWLNNNWADLLIDEGKYNEAAKRYQKVINSKTRNKKAMASAFEGLNRYYTALGQWNQVDAMYRKQIAFEPNSAWGYGNYAQFLLCKRDDYDNSILRSRQALNIMDYGVGRYWLAAALYRKWAQNVSKGGKSEGQKYYAEAQAIYPDLHGVLSDVANCPSLQTIVGALASLNQGSSISSEPDTSGTSSRVFGGKESAPTNHPVVQPKSYFEL